MISNTHVEVTIPAIEDLGSSYEGRRCHVIRVLAANGGMTLGMLCSGLHMGKRDAKEVLKRMVVEGTVVGMASGPRTTYFLADRNGWREKIALADEAATCRREGGGRRRPDESRFATDEWAELSEGAPAGPKNVPRNMTLAQPVGETEPRPCTTSCNLGSVGTSVCESDAGMGLNPSGTGF